MSMQMVKRPVIWVGGPVADLKGLANSFNFVRVEISRDLRSKLTFELKSIAVTQLC